MCFMKDFSRYKYLLDAPFEVSHMCCNVMKKKPTKKYAKENNQKRIMGIMASESKLRTKKWLREGCNSFESKDPNSAPMSFWTENDVLQYIRENNLPIADAYGEVVIDYEKMGQIEGQLNFGLQELYKTTGESRTGCIFCMFGITQDKERFARLKEQEPKLYEYVMRGGEFNEQGMWKPSIDGLGYKFVIDWLNEHGNLGIKY